MGGWRCLCVLFNSKQLGIWARNYFFLAGYFIFLVSIFLVCKMGIIIESTLLNCYN